MFPSSFSSSSPDYSRLLTRLFEQGDTTDAAADPIGQTPNMKGIGSSWADQLDIEKLNEVARSAQTITLSELTTGVLTAQPPAGLMEGSEPTADLSGLAVATDILYPGYALRYSPGFALENRAGVAQWQAQMQQRGWAIAVDGFYGRESARIARQFQAEKGLIADGIVGPQTWSAAFDTSTITGISQPPTNPASPVDPIDPITGSPSIDNPYPGSTLSYSSVRSLSFDPQAELFQQRLQTLGWRIEADGLFGQRSAAATRLFQQQNEIEADGIVGPQTWAIAFADNALSAPTQQDLNPIAATGRINAAGLELIKAFEGLRLNSYLDAVGVWTIGYGHTKTAGPGQRVSFAGATALLREDVANFERAVTRAVRVPVTANQYAALVSFAYNVGSGALNSSTLLRRLNAGDTFGAANEFRRWNRAGGRELFGLTRRREAERVLFLS